MAITGTNVTIMVRDMHKSISFYQSIGFSIINRWENIYAQLQAPGIVIGLHPASDTHTAGSGNVSIGFTTNDLNETKEMLERGSIPVSERNEEGGLFLHFNDPDGTQLYFIKPKWG